MTTKRYFMEETKIKPGVISEELRNALGISKKSLPIWIHRMRILGYPPGWLKKADMSNTTIDFINGDDDREEGQIDFSEKKTYNTDSFHEYPGFNAPVPVGVKDNYENLGMPPMQEFQQLNYAKQTVQALQPVPHRGRFNDYKDKDDEENNSDDLSDTNRRSEKSVSILNTSDENSSVKIIDSIITLSSDDEKSDLSDSNKMILDVEKHDFSSKPDESSSILFSPIFNQSNSNVSSNELNEVSQDGITDQRKENKSNISFLTESSRLDDSNFIAQEINLEKEYGKKIENNQKHQSDQFNEIDDNQDVNYQNANEIEKEITSKMTLVSMGAPVPASLNGEKPPLENFAVGMGDLVYFENLPTSTGMFDKMRKVIKKVRKKLSNSSTNFNASTSTLYMSYSSQTDQSFE